jgi:hypothetical protein
MEDNQSIEVIGRFLTGQKGRFDLLGSLDAPRRDVRLNPSLFEIGRDIQSL